MADITPQEVNSIAQIVAELLPTVLQFGIPLVEKTITFIKNDPKLPAASLADAINQRLADAAKNDQAVLSDTK